MPPAKGRGRCLYLCFGYIIGSAQIIPFPDCPLVSLFLLLTSSLSADVKRAAPRLYAQHFIQRRARKPVLISTESGAILFRLKLNRHDHSPPGAAYYKIQQLPPASAADACPRPSSASSAHRCPCFGLVAHSKGMDLLSSRSSLLNHSLIP